MYEHQTKINQSVEKKKQKTSAFRHDNPRDDDKLITKVSYNTYICIFPWINCCRASKKKKINVKNSVKIK
jgi:hypothetical protein